MRVVLKELIAPSSGSRTDRPGHIITHGAAARVS